MGVNDDHLYRRGVGLNQLPGEDPDQLRRSILDLWPRLTADRLVCPGHGEATDGRTLRTQNDALARFLGAVVA